MHMLACHMIESPDNSGEVVWNLCLSQDLEVGGIL